jgi:ribosome recycling factor
MLFDQDEYKLELEEILERFKEELSKIRSGKANISVFQKIQVESYGMPMGLTAVAKVIADGPMSVKLEIWDKSNVESVKEALEKVDLGARVSQEGNIIRVNFIPLTEEDRKEKANKVIPKLLNDFLTRARDIRRDYNDKVKSLDKVSEDDQERSYEKIQEILKEYESEFDSVAKNKKIELLTI